MKILDNISNGYKRIAAGIAIVAFLAIMYLALIPGGTEAAGTSSVISALSGTPIAGALVKLVAYPQYNATTDVNGNYSMPNVPIGTYLISASAPGYFDNVSSVTVTSSNTSIKDFSLSPLVPDFIPFLNDVGTSYDSGIQVFNPYDWNITMNITSYNLLNGNITNISMDIPPHTLGARYAQQAAGGVDFIGSEMVETSQPALVQGNIRTLATSTVSIAPRTKLPNVTVQYIPFMNDVGTSYDSGIQVFNPYDATITANITAYNLLNGNTTNLSYDILPHTMGARYAQQAAGGVDFIGSVKVETSQPALVQGNIRTLATGTVSIAPATKLQNVIVQYIPFLNDVGTSYDSGIQVFNPYDSTITANITAYNLLNGNTTTLSYDILPHTMGARYAQQAAGGVDFVGSVKVETSQPALVQGNIRTLATGTASIAPAVIES